VKDILYVSGIVLWIIAGFAFTLASSAPEMTLGALIGVSGSILFGCAAIVGALKQVQEQIEARAP
jgi:hypothetical protein